MNANVKTAPTVAPVAAPGADLKNMNSDELRAMLNVLRNNEIDLEDKELATNQKQQTAVVARIRELKANKAADLTKIAQAIKDQGFKVHELFSDSDIVAYATDKGLLTAKPTKVKRAGAGNSTAKTPNASESNAVFLIAPKVDGDHHRTVDTVHRQGRANENPFSITTPLLRAAGKDADDTIKNLTKLVQPESAEYAKSDAGKAELAKIAKLILKAAAKAKKAA